MSKRKNIQYVILIVCEGTSTEPNYFKGIREEVLKKNIWSEGISIEIRPKSRLEKETYKPTPHKEQRKKRPLKRLPISIPPADIEEEYKAVPTRYVREAQKGLEEEVFDEVWAVFDKDYHPKTKEAFELANTIVNGKKVNIAFSSISFEHWILLHYERNKMSFNKSEDVVNYMVNKEYITAYSKGLQVDIYGLLKTKTDTAILNASWLKQQVIGSPVYNLNPYTDVERLVKRLFKIETEIVWLSINSREIVDDLIIEISQSTPVVISISVTNNKSISHIFKKKASIFAEGDIIKEIEVNLGIIPPNASGSFDLEISPLPKDLSSIEICIILNAQNHLRITP